MDKLKGILDRLPAPVRHYSIALGSALLAWAGDSVLQLPIPSYLIAILSASISELALYYTSLTTQYGVGSKE